MIIFLKKINPNTFFLDSFAVGFQKKPHCHLLVWLGSDEPHCRSSQDVDSIVSCFMMHGPYGVTNPNGKCMKYGKCLKCFPRKKAKQSLMTRTTWKVFFLKM
jgi:hypothetical protein